MKTKNDERLRAFRERFGDFGGREKRVLPFVVEEIRASGAGDGQFTIRGHAAVFNRWSLDLGGFRERIAKGAFDAVLERNPDVLALWDHDTALTLARTKNKTLELRIDPVGLHYWARVAPTSYAEDLRVLLERGDVDQASFAFTIAPGGQEWKIREEDDGTEVVERTITEIADLYDVTVTAMGAYPQTDSSIARSLALSYFRDLETLSEKRDTEDEAAEEADEPPELSGAEERDAVAEETRDEVATDEPADEVRGGSEEGDDAPEREVDALRDAEEALAEYRRRKAGQSVIALDDLKAKSRESLREAKELFLTTVKSRD